jgi:predicted ATPase with chaperone activity
MGCPGSPGTTVRNHPEQLSAFLRNQCPESAEYALSDVVDFLNGQKALSRTSVDLQQIFHREGNYAEDFNEVKGQEHVKRALKIAAAGGRSPV